MKKISWEDMGLPPPEVIIGGRRIEGPGYVPVSRAGFLDLTTRTLTPCGWSRPWSATAAGERWRVANPMGWRHEKRHRGSNLEDFFVWGRLLTPDLTGFHGTLVIPSPRRDETKFGPVVPDGRRFHRWRGGSACRYGLQEGRSFVFHDFLPDDPGERDAQAVPAAWVDDLVKTDQEWVGRWDPHRVPMFWAPGPQGKLDYLEPRPLGPRHKYPGW